MSELERLRAQVAAFKALLPEIERRAEVFRAQGAGAAYLNVRDWVTRALAVGDGTPVERKHLPPPAGAADEWRP